MATPQEMVSLITQALSSGFGVAEINVDGQKVRYDRAQALDELAFWQRLAAKQGGRRPLYRGVNLSGAWCGHSTCNSCGACGDCNCL